MLAAANQLIGEVAPREAQTEAYTWPTTAIVTGVTVGNAASGAIIELQDWSAAFVMAAVVGATGFFVVMARRGTFESRAGSGVAPAGLRPLEQVVGLAEAVGDAVLAAVPHEHDQPVAHGIAAVRAGLGSVGGHGRLG